MTTDPERAGDNSEMESVEDEDDNKAPELFSKILDMSKVISTSPHFNLPGLEPMQHLPASVKRRIKALKQLQLVTTDIEAKFYEEVHALECTYYKLCVPLYEKRSEIVSGIYEPTDEQCMWDSDDDEEGLTNDLKTKANLEDDKEQKKEETETEETKGIPDFWLTIFKNVGTLADMVQEHDEPILKHLYDIKVIFLQSNPMGFVLEFHFESNEYFTNSVLTKEYIMKCTPDSKDPFSFEGPEIYKCKGCVIDWKKGKNVTVKTIKKNQKHKSRGSMRTVTKTVQNDSFFNFFSPPVVPENSEAELDDETQALLTSDFEIGHYIRERIVPRAVLYYTGEGLEDEDEDYEEEEGDEDDPEEEDLDDEESSPTNAPSDDSSNVTFSDIFKETRRFRGQCRFTEPLFSCVIILRVTDNARVQDAPIGNILVNKHAYIDAGMCQRVTMNQENRQILKQFHNCRILRDGKILNEDLWVRDGKIVNPEKIFYDEKIMSDVRIDCNGALISPGYIDLQINGGFGIDFTHNVNNVQDGINEVAKQLIEFGVTSFCPTLVTSPSETYHKVIPNIKKTKGGKHGASVLGIHLEGPFISPSKKGAHPENHIKQFENGFDSLFSMYGSLDNVCLVTLAPELPNAKAVIAELCKRDIKVSLGHSIANLHDGEEAVKSGASFITHLFNAMLPFHHRDPGLVGLLTSDQIPPGKIIHYGIIADGIHTHPAALRIAHRTHPEGLVLVTDALSALGLEEGVHQLGQLKIEMRGGCAYIAGTNTLCGSTVEMSKCVRYFKEATGCSIVEALEAATLHPARTLGMEETKGVLKYGADADLVILDKNLELLSTWISGECVYSVCHLGVCCQ